MRFALFAVMMLMAGVATAQTRDPGTLVRDIEVPRTPMDAVARPVADTAPTQPSDGAAFDVTIGAVVVDGVAALPRGDFAAAIEPFLGRQAEAAVLRDLAGAVANAARSRGYVFATASIPAQSVEAGRLRVTLTEGRIDEVRITGSKSERLRRTLAGLAGTVVMRPELERVLLLAGDIPSAQILRTRLVQEGTRAVLLVEARERRGEGYASLDTYGSDDIGPVRLRLRYDFAGLAGSDDVLTVQAVTVPLQPRELAFVTVRYAVPLGTGGTQVGVTASAGRAQPDLSGTDLTSTSRYIGVFASTPLMRQNAASIWANAELGFLRIDGRGDAIQRDSITTLNGWLYATAATGKGRLNGAIGVVRGLGIAGTTEQGDPFASRLDGSARFTKGYAWADWTMPLGRGLSLRLAANGQLADRPLLAAQEIGLGGAGFGRAFDFYDRFGDEGVMGSAELRWRTDRLNANRDWLQLYGFVDGGRVWNLNGGYGSGELASGGVGARLGLGKTDIGVEVAVPIAADSSLPVRKTARANVTVGRRF